MQLALETEVLFELSLAIGESAELEPMLRHVLTRMLRLLNGSGAKVVRVVEDEGGRATRAQVACAVPRNLNQHGRYRAFHERWPHLALHAALAEEHASRPLTVALDDATVHAFHLPGFGFLLFFKNQGALPEGLLRAFAPLARKLATSARACLVEEELRRQSHRLELATSSADIGVWEFEIANGTLSWDAQLFRLFGADPATFGGTLADFDRRLHPADRQRVHEAFWRTIHDDTPLELEFRIIRPGGEVRVFAGRGRCLRDAQGEPERVVGVNFDVTVRREAEDAIRRARDAAEAAVASQGRFIANMSHELRTPMNGIIGMTELALETELTETQRDYLRVVRSSAEGLLSILNDILDFSKADAGELRLEAIPFDLGALVTETLKAIAVRASRKGLALALDLPPTLPAWSRGDPGRLRQVLVNLCDNAVKFTATGEIAVHVAAAARDDGADDVTITVRDTGIGIPAAQRARIFEAFQQVDASVTRRYGGTGLGLSICRQLVTLMGGTLDVESVPGAGSTFTVRLPLARGTAPADAPPSPRALVGVRALVVDAHPVNRRTTRRWLERWGCTVDEAPDAAAAERRLAAGPRPAVLLIDAELPGPDGFALAAAVRARDATLPMLLLSAGARPGDAARCRDLGIAAFLTEPATPHELRHVLGRALASAPRAAPTPLFGARPVRDAGAARLRVLLVEDNPVNQEVARAMLETLGHDVAIAGNGREAVERTATERFDLAFMDMQMPELDGVAATRAIRAREAAAGEGRLPIVAMTANALDDERQACLDAGMDDHVPKPVRLATLEATIARHAPRAVAHG